MQCLGSVLQLELFKVEVARVPENGGSVCYLLLTRGPWGFAARQPPSGIVGTGTIFLKVDEYFTADTLELLVPG